MSQNLLFSIVICGLLWNIHAETNRNENSKEVAVNNSKTRGGRGFTALPKFVIQMITRSVKNIFQNLKKMLLRFEKYAKSLLGDTLDFLARSDNTTIIRKRRSPWSGSSQRDRKQNGGGVISKVSNLFMAPFKLAFGAVKWIPGAIVDKSAKLGVTVAGDILDSPIFQTMARTAIKTGEKVAEETWNFAKVNVFPKMDKWVTSMKESQSLPDNVLTFLTEMQTLYHLYRFLGLA